MTISNFTLTAACNAIAAEIFAEAIIDMADDETPETYLDDMNDRAHETADGHEIVIYHFKAHELCLYCNTDSGEEFLEDCGMPETPTYDSLASAIAYGEILARITAQINELVGNWEA